MPLMRTSETPLNAFLWRADDGPTLNAGFAALCFFRGSRQVLLRNPFCDFQRGWTPAPSLTWLTVAPALAAKSSPVWFTRGTMSALDWLPFVEIS